MLYLFHKVLHSILPSKLALKFNWEGMQCDNWENISFANWDNWKDVSCDYVWSKLTVNNWNNETTNWESIG